MILPKLCLVKSERSLLAIIRLRVWNVVCRRHSVHCLLQSWKRVLLLNCLSLFGKVKFLCRRGYYSAVMVLMASWIRRLQVYPCRSSFIFCKISWGHWICWSHETQKCEQQLLWPLFSIYSKWPRTEETSERGWWHWNAESENWGKAQLLFSRINVNLNCLPWSSISVSTFLRTWRNSDKYKFWMLVLFNNLSFPSKDRTEELLKRACLTIRVKVSSLESIGSKKKERKWVINVHFLVKRSWLYMLEELLFCCSADVEC